jgi:hypothetical protein
MVIEAPQPSISVARLKECNRIATLARYMHLHVDSLARPHMGAGARSRISNNEVTTGVMAGSFASRRGRGTGGADGAARARVGK